MEFVSVSSAKGGVGVTTVAGAIAVTGAMMGKSVLLVDFQSPRDTSALLGITDYDIDGYYNASVDAFMKGGSLKVYSPSFPIEHFDGKKGINENYDLVVIDAGRYQLEATEGFPIHRIGVARNEYVALKNTVNSARTVRWDKFVIIHHEGNALNANDCSHVLATECVTVPFANDMARAIDAGLFISRNGLYTEWASQLLPLAVA